MKFLLVWVSVLLLESLREFLLLVQKRSLMLETNMNIHDYQHGTAMLRLYRSKFKYEEDFEDLLKFLDLPLDYGLIDIEVSADKIVIDGKTYYRRSYTGR